MRIYIYVFLIAAAVTYLTAPFVRRMARRIGAITPVRDRDVHVVPIPRLGGLAMFLGFAAALLVASRTEFLGRLFVGGEPWGVLLGALVVVLLGVADDVWDLDAITKLAGQALAAGLMAWKGVQLVFLPIFGVTIPSFGTLFVLTVLIIVVTINAVNFVDGLDGLAAGILGIAGTAFFSYTYLLAKDQLPNVPEASRSYAFASLASLITAAMVGCCVGFLPHNFNPARVFMGDSGSMLLGLLLASSTVTITGVDPGAVRLAAPAFFPLVIPLAVLAVPLIDLGMAVVRRTRARAQAVASGQVPPASPVVAPGARSRARGAAHLPLDGDRCLRGGADGLRAGADGAGRGGRSDHRGAGHHARPAARPAGQRCRRHREPRVHGHRVDRTTVRRNTRRSGSRPTRLSRRHRRGRLNRAVTHGDVPRDCPGLRQAARD